MLDAWLEDEHPVYNWFEYVLCLLDDEHGSVLVVVVVVVVLGRNELMLELVRLSVHDVDELDQLDVVEVGLDI